MTEYANKAKNIVLTFDILIRFLDHIFGITYSKKTKIFFPPETLHSHNLLGNKIRALFKLVFCTF